VSGKKAQIIGWKYSLTFHMVLCHGPVDAIQAISFGEREAWSGNVTGNADIYVDAPKLFGGDQREGGVFGTINVAMGGSAQPQNAHLASLLGPDVPAFRGVLSLIFNSFNIGSNNPYLKKLAIRIKRIKQGWSTGAAWYPEKADISGAMNGAHIIYQCLTDTEWGMGYPTSSIDDANFRIAADILYNEGFGLCLSWNTQAKIEDFVKDVNDHIGALVRADPATGKFQIKLIRDDYDVGSLVSFDENNSTRTEFDRPNWGETTNEIVVKYTEMNSGLSKVVSVQDLANVAIQNSVVSAPREYPGIVSDDVAARIAMRDLKTVSTPLAKIQLISNRRAVTIANGDAALFSDANLGIVDMPIRVLNVSYGTLLDGAIKIDAVEDIYGLPNTSYVEPQPIEWVDPSTPPVPVTFGRVIEAPYWEVARTASAADFAQLDESSAFIASFAARPAVGMFSFNMAVRDADGQYPSDDGSEFAPTCLTSSALDYETTSVGYTSGIDMILDEIELGSYAYIDEEIIVVTAIAGGVLTIKRGMMDTVPAKHASGSRIYFAENNMAESVTEYLQGDTLQVKLLTVSALGPLEPSAAPTIVKSLVGRFGKPYAPGRVRIQGLEYPDRILRAPLTVTWAHRDRIQQTTPTLVDQYAGNIGPEAGTTYSISVYNNDTSALIDSATGLTVTTWSTSLLPEITFNMRIELWSIVASRVSFQKHVIILEVVEPVYRITEGGDSRVTEVGGNERIKE
jgi:hypothetical protein